MDSFGTDEYIEKVVKYYSPLLLRTAYTILCSTADAEDAVQDVFLKIITKKPRFNSTEHEKAWLLRVTINHALNMKKSSSRKNIELTENLISTEHKNREVLDAVMSLTERYRIVVYLFYYEGYSIKEISEILKLPSATVGTRLSRARSILKTLLEGDIEV